MELTELRIENIKQVVLIYQFVLFIIVLSLPFLFALKDIINSRKKRKKMQG